MDQSFTHHDPDFPPHPRAWVKPFVAWAENPAPSVLDFQGAQVPTKVQSLLIDGLANLTPGNEQVLEAQRLPVVGILILLTAFSIAGVLVGFLAGAVLL